MIREPRPVKVYPGKAGAVSETHVSGQGFESIRFVDERAIVNREWAEMRKSQVAGTPNPADNPFSDQETRQIRENPLEDRESDNLESDSRRGIRRSFWRCGGALLYGSVPRPGRLFECTYGQFACRWTVLTFCKWCSFCTDFGERLVLCASCRIGVCMTGAVPNRACLDWDAATMKDDFVFHCQPCSILKKIRCPVSNEEFLSVLLSHRFVPAGPDARSCCATSLEHRI